MRRLAYPRLTHFSLDARVQNISPPTGNESSLWLIKNVYLISRADIHIYSGSVSCPGVNCFKHLSVKRGWNEISVCCFQTRLFTDPFSILFIILIKVQHDCSRSINIRISNCLHPSWEANSRSASRENHRLLLNVKDHCSINNTPSPRPKVPCNI
jgi:hypothetical protein